MYQKSVLGETLVITFYFAMDIAVATFAGEGVFVERYYIKKINLRIICF
jgi:hypothetical protein